MSWFFMPPCQQPARWYPSLLERLHPGPAGIFGQTQTGSNLCRALSGSVSKGVGWATLGLGGGLPWCQLCHLCAASPSHPLWKSEKNAQQWGIAKVLNKSPLQPSPTMRRSLQSCQSVPSTTTIVVASKAGRCVNALFTATQIGWLANL